MGRHGENIRKRKDGRWEARMIVSRDGNGKAKYRSFYGKTYLEAKEKRNQYIRDRDPLWCLEHTDRSRDVTMHQLMEEWLFAKRESVRESTYAHYNSLVKNHILPELGRSYLSSLTAEQLNHFLKNKLQRGRVDRQGGLSPKTVSDIRSILLLGLEYARERKYPCIVNTKLFVPKTHRPEKKVLTLIEQEKLEHVILSDPDPITLGIMIALYCGLRIGEICALQWGDVHLETGLIRIEKTIIRIQNSHEDEAAKPKTQLLITHPKTECSHRYIPLPSFLIAFLEQYQQEEHIYLITGTSSYMEPRLCLNKYKKILKKAGLHSYTFHTLRHTFATRCVENGFDTKSLSEILGHANVNTTMQNYVHPSLELKRQQMERLKNTSIWGQNMGQISLKS